MLEMRSPNLIIEFKIKVSPELLPKGFFCETSWIYFETSFSCSTPSLIPRVSQLLEAAGKRGVAILIKCGCGKVALYSARASVTNKWPLLFPAYAPALDNSLVACISRHFYVDDSHIYTLSAGFFPKLLICIYRCIFDISSSVSNRPFKLSMSKIKLLSFL